MLVQTSGTVTYNGHGLDEFIPERTSAYVTQYDEHMAELTGGWLRLVKFHFPGYANEFIWYSDCLCFYDGAQMECRWQNPWSIAVQLSLMSFQLENVKQVPRRLLG